MTIIEQLEQLQADYASIQANLESANAKIVGKDEEITGLQAKLAEFETGKAALEASHSEALAGIQGKLDAEIAAHAESKKTIEDISKKLSDPAFKVASIPGDASAVADGGVVSGNAESKTLAMQMREIKDPKERRAFYLANEKEIKAGL